MRAAFTALKKVERRKSTRILLLLAVAAFAFWRMPLTPFAFHQAVRGLHERHTFLYVYSHVQGRPMEQCPAFEQRHKQALDNVPRLVGEPLSTFPNPVQLARVASVMHAELRAVILRPSFDDCWRSFQYFGYFQGHFSRDLPFIWLYDTTGFSAVHIAFALILISWVSCFCFYSIVMKLTGSRLVGVFSVPLMVLAWKLTPSPANPRFNLNTQALDIVFVFIFLGFHLPLLFPRKGKSLRVVAFAAAVIALVFAAHLSYHIYPVMHRMNGMLLVVSVIAAGLVRRRWRSVLAGLLAGAALMIWSQSLDRYGNQFYSQVTRYNQSANEAFASISPIVGLFERPNAMGLPPSDLVFTRLFQFDAFTRETEPYMIVHQSLGYIGRALFLEMARIAPMAYPEAVAKRFFDQTVLHAEMAKQSYSGLFASGRLSQFAFWAALLSFCGVGCLTLFRMRYAPLTIPIFALSAWHLFGTHTFFYVLHNHLDYAMTGHYMIVLLTPAFLVVAWKRRESCREIGLSLLRFFRPSDARRGGGLSSRRFRIASSAAVALVFVSALPSIIRGVRREILSVKTWQMLHVDPFISPNETLPIGRPADYREILRKFNDLGEAAPGENEMFIAYALWTYRNQNQLYAVKEVASHGRTLNTPLEQAKLREEAERELISIYRSALEKAPDNAYFSSSARLMGDPEWAVVFRKAVDRNPDGPYVALMSWELYHHAESRAEKEKYVRIFEDVAGRFLKATSGSRLGFERLPRVAGQPNLVLGADEVKMNLRAGEAVTFTPLPTKAAWAAMFSIYVRPERSPVLLEIKGRRSSGEEVTCGATSAGPEDLERYRTVRCSGIDQFQAIRLSMRAESGETPVTIRDYYPIFQLTRVPALMWKRFTGAQETMGLRGK